MKTTSRLMLALMAALFVATGFAGTLQAHDGQWDNRHHYYRNNYGYWNEHDHYTHYTYWGHHHGYWDNRGGTRIFINVD